MKIRIIYIIVFLFLFMGGYLLFASYETLGTYVPSPMTIVPLPILQGSGIITRPKTCIKNPKIRFFMYHYIRDDDPLDTTITHNLSIPPSVFDAQMSFVEKLAKSGSITLMKGNEFMNALKSDCYPSEHVWIFTDDDGWSDTYSDLMPIATNHGIPFFFGIIGNRIDRHGFITSGEVRAIADNPLFTISSHSFTHDGESKMSVEKEQEEMCESKKLLENITGKSVNTYIYPSGRMNASGSTENLRICGYIIAWTTNFGKIFDPMDPHSSEINRIRVGRDDGEAFFEKYLKTD